MKKAVAVILTNSKKQILLVSRKDDHSNFSFPGGKVEETDLSLEDAIVRETMEETGLKIYNLKMVHSETWGGYTQYAFVADWVGKIETTEPHVVKWGTPEELKDRLKGELKKLEDGTNI